MQSYPQDVLIRGGIGVVRNVSGPSYDWNMTTATDSLLTEAAAFAAGWAGALIVGGISGCAGAGAGAGAAADAGIDVERMSDAGLLRVLTEGFAVKRHTDALLARAAGQVVTRSNRFLGAQGLASRTGNSDPATLVADLGRISLAEAGRLCRVAEATMVRVSLLGERLSAKYPLVAAALNTGTIPVDSAQWIVSNLDQTVPRANPDGLVEAERELVEFAESNPADPVRKLAIRWRDALDEDGLEPREKLLVERRALRRTTMANGMKRYRLELDPLSAGYVDTAIDALVGAALRGPRMEAGQNLDGCDDNHEELTDGRTIQQIGADAMVDLARHALSCTQGPGPLPHTELVVRMTLESLLSGLGEAQIDGIEQPISAATARNLAADAKIIPMVLGGNSEVLDLGVGRRLFSHGQRLAFAERDGGCAWPNCKRPPSYTEAHHIRWWSNGGTTDLSNGVLTCSPHHHRIHRDGWEIRLNKNNVLLLIPPDKIDIYRTPRRMGRPPIPRATGRAGRAGRDGRDGRAGRDEHDRLTG